MFQIEQFNSKEFGLTYDDMGKIQILYKGSKIDVLYFLVGMFGPTATA